VGEEPGGTSAPIHGFGYLFSALRRQGLIADELVLQLMTFLRSLDLFLELIVLTPRTLTANQVRHGGKQGTDNPELSRSHLVIWSALTSLPRSLTRYAALTLRHESPAIFLYRAFAEAAGFMFSPPGDSSSGRAPPWPP
jgi:hypothetical protein